MRQMSYSMCRFWAYDESKKLLGAGKDAPAWKLAAAGSMGASLSSSPVSLFDADSWGLFSGWYCGFCWKPWRFVFSAVFN
jgi:hypothetical protein